MMANILKSGTFAFVRIAPLRVVMSKAFQGFLYHVYYRVWCPGGNERVRDCIAAGECGCNNRDRP